MGGGGKCREYTVNLYEEGNRKEEKGVGRRRDGNL